MDRRTMTRSAARRSAAVQADKSALPPPTSEPRSGDPFVATETKSGIPWYWGLVLFLWATSYFFLLLYEWLAGVLKSFVRA